MNISSQFIIQEKDLYNIPAFFDNNYGHISLIRIEATKFEPETAFEKNIDEIKADQLKIITSLGMNVSAIISEKNLCILNILIPILCHG